ncbi:dedicator of cytokinesis protein 9 isoform X2 [Sitodiplosis mosellana]|nr:dedicator of cytokinesis protein 9 isoform X2 [Sitodiplosis mosellana]
MAERKFTRGLNKPGMAAQLRESVSQVVRESAVLNKPLAVQPIDFESFVAKNKTLIQNDPQRELLIYPTDDVSQVVLPRKFRTTSNFIPILPTLKKEVSSTKLSNGSLKTNGSPSSNSLADEAKDENITNGHNPPSSQSHGLLLTRQALHTYQSNNHLVHYKYSAYSGSYHELPKSSSESTNKEEVYEVDTDPDRIDEEMTRSQADSITKQGYLYKGPDTASDRMFAHIGSKSFKRRYCYLRQEVDGTYILELHKDEKQCEAKATIVMDFCTEVVQNPKRGRFCFELRMTAGHKSFTLAADNESDMQDWLTKLQSVLNQNKIQEDTRSATLEREKTPNPNQNPNIFGTLKGLDQSMNPQLMKYGRETDISIAQARREHRRKLFNCYSQLLRPITHNEVIDPYREQFGHRILIKCDSLKFRLQTPLENCEKETYVQAEPYFTSLALYDAKNGRKLTENFYFDLNSEHVRDMMVTNQNTLTNGQASETNGVNGTDDKPKTIQYQTLPKEFDALPADWMKRPKQAVLNVTTPHPDVFLVVKIEKILQGGINNTSDAYLKAGKDPKMGPKLNKNVKQYSQKIGHYRMPFAWAARPLFRLYSSDLDSAIEFPAIYRQDANKLKDEDILKLLTEYRKPDKFSKLTVIPGFLKIMTESISELPNNSLTTTLMPLKPFPMPPTAEPSFEIAEFSVNLDRDMYPYTTFVNHLFIYPQSLSFDSQKLFSRARNVAVTIEVRESDTEGAKSIPCMYGRAGQSMLLDKISCPVLHHNTNPTWYEEVKIRLPLNITANHHLLFSFVHVSCDLSKRRDANTSYESAVGYSWMPLLSKGKINVEEQVLPVAAALPAGYLAIQPLGLGKGQNAGPDIQWIDNQRPIFAINFRLESTVLTTDQHLHNLFVHSERLLQQGKLTAQPAESETCKILKAAHAIQVKSVITFLPTILNQLFTLLVNTTSEDIALNVIRLLINLIHTVAEEAGRKELINSYVKFVFQTTHFLPKMNGNTVHSELCRYLPSILNPSNTDFLVVNKFMKYSNIFFDIIVKSMAQHLLHSGRIRMHRNERFTDEFEAKVENLFEILVPYLFTRHKDLPNETQILNKNLSVFIKRCLTFMDRGFVFKLIRLYLDRFSSSDLRILHEYKFGFMQEICSHEHYVPLNLPILLSPNSRQPNLIQRFTLSEEFCRQHFLAGILLQEVKSALNEVGHIRKMSLNVLKEILAKHDLDDRYQGKGQAARLAMIYIPWLGIVMENRSRIFDGNECRPMDSMSICTSRYSTGGSYVFGRDSLVSSNSIMSANSTPKLRSRLNQTSPCRTSLLLKDTNYLAAIAGQQQILRNGHSTNSLDSECSALSNDTTILGSLNTQSDSTIRPGHARSISMAQPPMIPRLDKFNESETKDLLICFLFVVKNLSQEHMILWWQNCTESETISFFGILDYCLINFRYVGKKNIVMNVGYLNTKLKTSRSHTLPARVSPQNGEFPHESGSSGTLNHSNTRENLVEEATRSQIASLESSLAAEVGLIILDCMGLYTLQFRDKMLDGSVLPKLAQVYLRFLQLGQSENLSKHVFAALRAFINNFSTALFRGNAALCGQIVYELLKCCDSRLTSIRQDACAVLYLLMRSNFEFSGRKGLTRVHLQVIISVSQMIGNVIGLNNARFQESLSMINSYATSDKAMKGTGFPTEVKDLTKRVRTVLMATAQMQAHHMDPERLLELQQSLANSYSTPELRHTWLVTMARNHEQNGDLSEAAMCNLHIAALIAEYLKLKGSGFVNWGAEAFGRISRNIPVDEKGLKLDSGTPDSQYTEQMLLEQLKDCAEYLDRGERYECLGELYRLIVPILENKRDYTMLAQCYEHLAQSYSKVNEVNRSGKRMLGRFYRVVFFGQIYFEEDSGVEYIYKEPKLTSLSEISERLYKQYKDKYGADCVKMIQDSSPVNVNDLDPKVAYIQVTHSKPYFCKDELETRQNFFEQNHDVDTFQFETPFTKNGTAHGSVEEQWKRRTILTTMYSFPYVLKRIPVKHKQAIELNPIEVAIDEMQNRVSELEEVVMPPIDVKKLQLRLQGSVAVQVNAGPLAYANAFLNPKENGEDKYSEDKIDELKDIFREFVSICNTALQVNGRMISNDQREYHAALKDNYEKLCIALSDLLDESFLPIDESNSVHRNSLALFSAISGAPNNSSTA